MKWKWKWNKLFQISGNWTRMSFMYKAVLFGYLILLVINNHWFWNIFKVRGPIGSSFIYLFIYIFWGTKIIISSGYFEKLKGAMDLASYIGRYVGKKVTTKVSRWFIHS